jgi:aspartate/methionine/tyrosine aminotransferase
MSPASSSSKQQQVRRVVSERSQAVASFKVMDVLRRANELDAEVTAAAAAAAGGTGGGGHNHNHLRVLHCEVGQPETGAPAAVARAAADALLSPLPPPIGQRQQEEEPPAHNEHAPAETTPAHRNVMGYTDAFGLLALREKISDHYSSYYCSATERAGISSSGSSGGDGLGDSTDNAALSAKRRIPVQRIVVTTGSSGAFLLAFTACFDAGDVVAVASSGYPCYRNILLSLGCRVATVSLNARFKLTAAELEREIDRRHTLHLDPIKGLVLSSPGNPTGTQLAPTELAELCRVTDAHGIQFLSDEIYHGISYGDRNDTVTALQYSNRVVVINSFSKYYSSECSRRSASESRQNGATRLPA